MDRKEAVAIVRQLKEASLAVNDAVRIATDHTQESRLRHQIGGLTVALHLDILPRSMMSTLICVRRRRNRGSAASYAGAR